MNTVQNESGGVPLGTVTSPFNLYVGVISGEPQMLEPLLDSLLVLEVTVVVSLYVIVLSNGCAESELNAVIARARNNKLKVALVGECQQQADAENGAFGHTIPKRLSGQVSICLARTMLQRYLGEILSQDSKSFGWMLDDDMRVDSRAIGFLSLLPRFKAQGTDVLIGAYEGLSPNPPLNGLRVQLFDFLHNYCWLRGMPGNAVLPDRSRGNQQFREKYPDYYYDLSRKHVGHLETPCWLEPVAADEKVKSAFDRLLAGAIGMLSGTSLTRSLVVNLPDNPLASAYPSVNRGGNTLVLNHLSLTQTPNLIPQMHGRHLRRSDMVWALLNCHYRNMNVEEVGFPVNHVSRIETVPKIDFDKIREEVLGAAFYAALTDFFRLGNSQQLDFTAAQMEMICNRTEFHLEERLIILSRSMQCVCELRDSIRLLPSSQELQHLLSYLDDWFTPRNHDMILSCADSLESDVLYDFLCEMKDDTDSYAKSTICIKTILSQFLSDRDTRNTH